MSKEFANNRIFDTGQYMLIVTSTLMMELQNKIFLSVRMMSLLIEMTTLSRHHIELNNTTIQWLRRIRPVLERSSALYEQMKFELEEKLQEKVATLNAYVEEMFPRYAYIYVCAYVLVYACMHIRECIYVHAHTFIIFFTQFHNLENW